MKKILLTMALAGLLPALFLRAEPAPSGMDGAALRLLGRRSQEVLGSANARRSVRGTKALWTELSIQKPGNDPAFANMEADLKATEVEGQLRTASFRLMDPKKRSLALGLRPTLVLSVYFVPKGSEGNDTDFYLVTVGANQDVTPLGGEKMTMTTWMKVGDPLPSVGHIHADIDAIRASARALVLAFIDVAQDNDGAPAPGAKP